MAMTKKDIQDMQRRLGVEPDGFWGPRSIAACQKHLRSLMPKVNPWPVATPAALKRFYGDPATDEVQAQLVIINAALGMRYEGRTVEFVRCHERVAESLERILYTLAQSDYAYVLADYAGVYNHRPMRGGQAWSLHSYGAAIDLLPESNGNRVAWPAVATMPLGVMEIFAREGWLSAGAFWGRDAMHFQATR
jgi:hypothetical protein